MNPSHAQATDRLAEYDFARHNEEVRAVWDTLAAGSPIRVPIILGTNMRYFIFNDSANPERLDFQRFSENPDIMFDAVLRFARWSRFNLLQDCELGMPEKWSIAPNFQNYYEAAWFGCPIQYLHSEVPDTLPAFTDAPERIMENGIPGPFDGFGARAREYYEHFCERASRETYLDIPIDVAVPMCGTDGPMTVACNVFGADQVCELMADDPDRLHVLLDFITEATVKRMTAWRHLAGTPVPQKDFGFADDSVALISTPMYLEHILPFHRRLCDQLSDGTARSIHLCGDATRHFTAIHEELGIVEFDTGFPIDFREMRRRLGAGVRFLGGPHVGFLIQATPEQVRDEVKRILSSGVLDGGQFVLREGNNLPPRTPIENTEAMYWAGREFGNMPLGN